MELIVAVDRRWGIGRDGSLLFSIPEDLAYFRRITWGHPIILGRKTLATFPGGAPLPGRENLVLTRGDAPLPQGAVRVSDLEVLSGMLRGREPAYVVGGASVYRQLLGQCRRAHVTKVDADGGADCTFPDLDTDDAWHLTEIGAEQVYKALRYRRCLYERVDRVAPAERRINR